MRGDGCGYTACGISAIEPHGRLAAMDAVLRRRRRACAFRSVGARDVGRGTVVAYVTRMAHKQLLFRSEARTKLLRGATTLADAIRITFGPRSKSILIAKKWGLTTTR
jgi:hypothetical protein